MSGASRSGYAWRISASLMPSATISTTVATGMRRFLMMGTPPMRFASMVMRVNFTPGTFRVSTIIRVGTDFRASGAFGCGQYRRLARNDVDETGMHGLIEIGAAVLDDEKTIVRVSGTVRSARH
jgi:hypothetical protein